MDQKRKGGYLDKLHNTKLGKKFHKKHEKKRMETNQAVGWLNELRGPERQKLLYQPILYHHKPSTSYTLQHLKCWLDKLYQMFHEYFSILGPSWPSAGGPRMDRRAVTSSGFVKISCLASRLRRSDFAKKIAKCLHFFAFFYLLAWWVPSDAKTSCTACQQGPL